MRIAMWSGPRNLSTAMMYSFGARQDFTAMDEPFYAAYLKATGLEHPMRDAVLAAQEQDPARVPLGFVQDGARHLYMKHMAQHMIDGFPLDWAEDCVNIHLIRHPARVIASYAAKREAPRLADIGFDRQL
ncbi:MAG: sulfotransferase-like domain-containing protein, partial [Sulfitobacter sp.]